MIKRLKNSRKLENFPISFFSTILGMAGFAIIFQKAEELLNISQTGSLIIILATILFYVILLMMYGSKLLLHTKKILEEFKHPIKINFFPTISISLLLFSVFFLSVNMLISKILWIIGTSIHLIFTLAILSIWIQKIHFKYEHFNPAWFIPVVGNLIIPIAGVEHFTKEISWFFFSIGSVFWLVLFSVFVNRIIFHSPLPEKLLPTLFILIAPPAIGFVSIVKLSGEINDLAKVLYYFSSFLILLLVVQFKIFTKIKFYLSWWAYSFPIAAFTIATILMYHETGHLFFKILFSTLSIVFTLLIILLTVKTFLAMKRGEICIEE